MLTALTTRSLSSGRRTWYHTAFSHVHDSVGILTSFGSVKQISPVLPHDAKVPSRQPTVSVQNHHPLGSESHSRCLPAAKLSRYQPVPRRSWDTMEYNRSRSVLFSFSPKERNGLHSLPVRTVVDVVSSTPFVVLGSDCVGDRNRFNETNLVPRKKDFYKSEFLPLEINRAPALLPLW